MKFMRACLCLLIACTPLLVKAANKMIFIIPRQVRRVNSFTPSTPWHPYMRYPFMKTKFLNNEFLPSHSRPRFHPHPQFSRPKSRVPFNKDLPHGGDDFDQGHQGVNHIQVPHGKHISHAISFGKGYVPHEALAHHAGFAPVSAEEPQGYSSPQVTQQASHYYQNDEGSHSEEVEERKTEDDRLSLKMLAQSFDAPVQGFSIGNKPGIYLQNDINFSEYEKKVTDLNKIWPQPHSTNTNLPAEISLEHGSPFISYLQQGYAVKEDIQDIPHDFKAMPIQTAPQTPTVHQPLPSNQPLGQPLLQHQPVQHQIVQALPGPQPGYFALAGFNGILHG